MNVFVKNNNTVYYNILPKLIKTYNNRYHSTIKMKPIEVNEENEKCIKENIWAIPRKVTYTLHKKSQLKKESS